MIKQIKEASVRNYRMLRLFMDVVYKSKYRDVSVFMSVADFLKDPAKVKEFKQVCSFLKKHLPKPFDFEKLEQYEGYYLVFSVYKESILYFGKNYVKAIQIFRQEQMTARSSFALNFKKM